MVSGNTMPTSANRPQSLHPMAVAFLALLVAVPAALATHLPTYSRAASSDGFTIELSWTGHVMAGVKHQFNLTLRNPAGQALQWQELQLAAARHAHVMVAGCDAFIHVHVEDFTMEKAYGQQLPGAKDVTFKLWLTLPHAGRYVAGIEFVDPLGGEHVAYVPLEALTQPSSIYGNRHPQRHCDSGPTNAVSRIQSLPLSSAGLYVGPVVLSDIQLPPWLPGAASVTDAASPPDGFDVSLTLAPVGGSSTGDMGGMHHKGGVVAEVDVEGGLSVGRCYRVHWLVSEYGTGKPVTDLVPFLTHTMHIAVVPVHSLWTLDHFHAVAGDGSMMMEGEDMSGNPCDMDDDSMPQAPANFGPMLTSWYQFKMPGTYRLICQSLRAGNRMLLASFVVHVRGDTQQATA